MLRNAGDMLREMVEVDEFGAEDCDRLLKLADDLDSIFGGSSIIIPISREHAARMAGVAAAYLSRDSGNVT